MDEEFYILLEKLRESGKPVIVEGKKDRTALLLFGITNIFTLDRPLFAIVEDVSAKSKEAAILTDLDKKGKFLYGKLKPDLLNHGVQIDDDFRNFLFRNTKIRQIEALKNYAEQV